ncbi:MAG: hypothetical protein ACRDKZ_01485 [Actinomycetota bacterium]
MAKAQELLYAVVGAGDFVVDKAKSARKIADRRSTTKMYKDFVKRGKTLSNRIQKSAPTQQAVAQTKAARSQVKAAATSAGKALRANSKAASSAAGKAAKAS